MTPNMPSGCEPAGRQIRGCGNPTYRVLALAGLCVALGPAVAGPLDDARKLVGTTWYTVSLLDQRVGYSYTEVEVDDNTPGGPYLRVTAFMHAELKLLGSPVRMVLETDYATIYDSDLRLVEARLVSNELGRPRELTARVGPDKIEAVVTSGGTQTRKEIPLTPEFGSDLSLSLAILRGQAQVGDRAEFDAFEPTLVDLERQTMVVTGTRPLTDGRQGYVVETTMRRIPVKTESLITPDGEVITATTTYPLKMVLQKTTREEALAHLGLFEVSSEIPTNKQLGDPKNLTRLRIRVTVDGQAAADLIPTTPRQTVEADGDAAVVTLRKLPADGPSVPLPISGPEFTPYLVASEKGQTDDPLIVETARSIVGDETDARRAAARIVHWVYHNVRKVSSEPRPFSAREVLDQRAGDCTEHATLCAALCAAVGIPAKMVTGLAYTRGSFFYHAWNELYVGEWVEMDPTWGEETVDAGHLRLAASSLDTEDTLRALLTVARSFGMLKISIENWEN